MGIEARKNKKFDREFKISAVKMITEEGHKAAEVARSLGIQGRGVGSKLLTKIK